MSSDLLILTIFAVWFLLLILCQIRPSLVSRLRWWDFFFLLPNWSLFTPPPPNYHLLYRDQLPDGTLSQWTMVEFRQKKFWRNLFWGADHRPKIYIWFTLHTLRRLIERKPHLSPETTVPYQLILNYLFTLPRSPNSTHRQFKLMQGFGYIPDRRPEKIFTSELHPWPNA